MKFIYSFIILSASYTTVFSQSNSVSVIDTSHIQNDCFEKEQAALDFLEKNLKYFSKVPDRLANNSNEIKFIPLPPATPFNSKAEQLPLHKPGDINLRLLKKSNKEHR